MEIPSRAGVSNRTTWMPLIEAKRNTTSPIPAKRTVRFR